MMYKNSRYLIATTLCTLLLSAPVVTQAASSDELAVMRAQLTALTERLDRLEAENRALTSANAEMLKNNQQTAVAVAEVTEKTAAVAAEVKEQAAETDWTDSMRWKGDFRYRFESFDIEGKPNRDRNRVRARAALIADVTPNFLPTRHLVVAAQPRTSGWTWLTLTGRDSPIPIFSVANSAISSIKRAKTACSGMVTGGRKAPGLPGITAGSLPMVSAPGLKVTATRDNHLLT
jgi:uncharacterized protein (UPF0335 family)